jgi:hypothetical protein
MQQYPRGSLDLTDYDTSDRTTRDACSSMLLAGTMVRPNSRTRDERLPTHGRDLEEVGQMAWVGSQPGLALLAAREDQGLGQKGQLLSSCGVC